MAIKKPLVNYDGRIKELISGDSISGASSDITEVEIDFGSIPITSKKFTITDARVNISNKVLVYESGNPATNTLVEKENTLVEKINTFDIFWEVYPNKKSKYKAKEIFDKKIKSWIDPNVLIAWAKKYKTATIWKDKLYIKHPTTRLNQWCREDEQTIDIEVLKKLYQQEVAKDKENKKAIWDKFISEYWSDIMQQVLDKINTSSFISSLL